MIHRSSNSRTTSEAGRPSVSALRNTAPQRSCERRILRAVVPLDIRRRVGIGVDRVKCVTQRSQVVVAVDVGRDFEGFVWVTQGVPTPQGAAA